MAANGIDESLRDDFVRHAVKFDDDDNQYLKKAEIEAAAEAWGGSDESSEETDEEAGEEEATEEEANMRNQKMHLQPMKRLQKKTPTEEAVPEEATAEEAAPEDTDSKVCPICNASNHRLQSLANLVDLRSDYKGYSQRGHAWSLVSSDTIMITILGKVRSISSKSCTAGGITPTLISTASHASGYCLSHASTSAIIPSGGTPGRTLAR